MKQPTLRLALAPIAALALFASGLRAPAQVTNIWTNTVNGVWSALTNWTPLAPVSASNTVLQFDASGTATYRATNDVANFALNKILLNSSSGTNIFLVGSN